MTMKGSGPLTVGIVGAALGAICCATSILVIGLGAVGLSALATYLDAVLLPLVAVSIGLVVYGLYRKQQGSAGSADAACCVTDTNKKTSRSV
jgi:mercuric ion transport protein